MNWDAFCWIILALSRGLCVTIDYQTQMELLLFSDVEWKEKNTQPDWSVPFECCFSNILPKDTLWTSPILLIS